MTRGSSSVNLLVGCGHSCSLISVLNLSLKFWRKQIKLNILVRNYCLLSTVSWPLCPHPSSKPLFPEKRYTLLSFFYHTFIQSFITNIWNKRLRVRLHRLLITVRTSKNQDQKHTNRNIVRENNILFLYRELLKQNNFQNQDWNKLAIDAITISATLHHWVNF